MRSIVVLFSVFLLLSLRKSKGDTDLVKPWFEDQLVEYSDSVLITGDNGNINEVDIPEWLDGSFIANGPGQFTTKSRNVTSLLDGLAYLSKFNIKNGKVWYQSEYINSKMFNTTRKNDNFCKASYMADVVPPFKMLETKCNPDNTNVNVWNIPNNDNDPNDKFYAFTDSTFVNSFNPASLHTVDQEESFSKIDDLKTKTAIDTPMSKLSCSHPHIDTRNGDLINFIVTSIPPFDNTVSIYRMKGSEEREVIGQVKLDKMPYMHSFAMTENYVLLFVFPVSLNLKGILESEPVLSTFEWTGDTDPTKIYIFDLPPPNVKYTGKDQFPGPVAVLETDPFFAFHHVTAYEENIEGKPSEVGINIQVDIIAYDSLEILENPITFGPLDVMLDSQKRNQINIDAQYRRYTINRDTESNEFKLTKISNILPMYEESGDRVLSVDFPVVSPRVYNRKGCFVYLVSYGTKTENWDSVGISKINLCEMKQIEEIENMSMSTEVNKSTYETKISAWVEDGLMPNEPIFVPNPNGMEEDDGVLLSQVYDTQKEKTFLAIIDAKTMKLISAIYAPIRVPFRFHGQFFEKKH